MTNSKSTKRALFTSALAMLMCVAMLIGTTFAWFTDTASTAVNKIQSGTLDVDIVDKEGNSLNGKTLSFKDKNGSSNILWEPGVTFNLDSFKIVNKGNLAFEYKIFINGVDGNAKLLEAIDFTATIGESKVSLNALTGKIVPADKAVGEGEVAGETELITISGHMKEEAGNEYQNLSIDGIGITVVATQYTYEYDSNGKTYDEEADATIQVNTDNIQDYLDGKYGTIDGATLVLAAGEYDKLELGRATKYAGSNTQYYNTAEGFSGTAVTLEELKNSNSYRYYIRSMSNVTFKAADDAEVKIAGIEMVSGHLYGSTGNPRYDYVLDDSTESTNNSYNLAHKVYNITFEKITFNAASNIASSSNETVINGFTFKNCTFNLGSTEKVGANRAIRYYKEYDSSAVVSNLIVENCSFSNFYQGVFTQNVYGVTVTGCKFSTSSHNAIAVQAMDGVVNHGAVVITNNKFENVPKPVIRFGLVGSDTQITIKGNKATNCGEAVPETGETTSYMVIEAASLAAGVTYNISGNTWETDTETYPLSRSFSHDVFKDK